MAATAKASTCGLPPEFDRAIPFPHLVMELAQDQQEPLIFGDACTRRPIPPRIVAAATHRQCSAEPRHSIGSFVSPNERVFHVDSLAKYAAAFF